MLEMYKPGNIPEIWKFLFSELGFQVSDPDYFNLKYDLRKRFNFSLSGVSGNIPRIKPEDLIPVIIFESCDTLEQLYLKCEDLNQNIRSQLYGRCFQYLGLLRHPIDEDKYQMIGYYNEFFEEYSSSILIPLSRNTDLDMYLSSENKKYLTSSEVHTIWNRYT